MRKEDLRCKTLENSYNDLKHMKNVRTTKKQGLKLPEEARELE